MVGRLGDYHADLVTPYGRFGPPAPAFFHHFDPGVVESGYTGTLNATPSGRIRFGRIGGEVGYVAIPSFEGDGWGGEMDGVLAALHNVWALVVDVRDNGGGNERNAQEVAARFADSTRPYRISRFRTGDGYEDFGPPVVLTLVPGGARRFAGPVVLLTNRYVASAGEDFVCMFRVRPGAVVMGDTTLGVGSRPLNRTSPRGWQYRVPQSVQSTADGLVYQGRGIPPEVAVPWGPGADPYLDAALLELAHRSGPGGARQ
ncbi:MAG: S41 family peptidase [Gemmatimonadetes bacterium]|nr:S41 family peptidase [Gemmatimonadota bacterium]